MMSVVASDRSLFIAGTWEEAEGPPIDVVNPATEDRLASVPSASHAQVEAALDAARAAQFAWAELPPIQRSAHLRAIADIIEEHSDDIARLVVLEVGKPMKQALGEVAWSVAYTRYMAEWDRRIEGEIVPSDNEHEVIHLHRVPLGVVAAICPWNFPVALFARKVAPALVTGNTVVLKPSEVTPLSTLRITHLLHDNGGLPPGVLNVVTGDREVGRSLVRSPTVDLVTMTGHRDSGKRVMADAAENLTRVSLELGGKAPAIVARDADPDLAVESLITARHTNAGQVCTCAERIFVDQHLYKKFVETYTAAAKELRIGDPMNDVDLGPLVNRAQLDKTEQNVVAACGDGATLLAGGQRPSGRDFDRGYWYEPTVFVDVDPAMPLMTEEVFGPVTPIMAITSFEEGLRLANDSRYGLSAYIFTNDYRTAMRTANDVAFGEIYINRSHGESVQAHHIGHRESGMGGEDGKYGVLKYTQLKTVYHRFGQ
jgi:lactaldehyde dehydrogenase/glycolaldehyde dehydrogenase